MESVTRFYLGAGIVNENSYLNDREKKKVEMNLFIN